MFNKEVVDDCRVFVAFIVETDVRLIGLLNVGKTSGQFKFLRHPIEQAMKKVTRLKVKAGQIALRDIHLVLNEFTVPFLLYRKTPVLECELLNGLFDFILLWRRNNGLVEAVEIATA